MYLDSNIAGNNVGDATKVNSWRECAEVCETEATCHAFSFIHDKDNQNYRNCQLKNNKFAETLTGSVGTVSVPKVCKTDSTGTLFL